MTPYEKNQIELYKKMFAGKRFRNELTEEIYVFTGTDSMYILDTNERRRNCRYEIIPDGNGYYINFLAEESFEICMPIKPADEVSEINLKNVDRDDVRLLAISLNLGLV